MQPQPWALCVSLVLSCGDPDTSKPRGPALRGGGPPADAPPPETARARTRDANPPPAPLAEPAMEVSSCPPGSHPLGAPPPKGTELGCIERRADADVLVGPYRRWNAAGDLRVEGTYADGKKTGRWTEYGENGRPTSEATWLEGQFDGAWRTFHPNGQLSGMGSYLRGKKHGPAVFRAEDGTVTLEENWRNDRRDGPFRESWPGGHPKARGQYRNGEKHGRWTEWTEDGTPTESEHPP